ncbi:photosystem II CP47 chlorophyll apoprotein, partial [Trifolium pratense]
ELSSRKSSIQQDIASFKQKIIFIDKRVPELEAEKKVATAARNFKEAARIATEAKSLCVEKENIQMEMDTATSNLEKLEEEIKGTLDKLQESEGMISLKEKELAMARYQKLLLTAATARAEKAAAQEMGDVEEANLLLAEAEAADCEAERIRSTYNFKVEDISNLRKDLVSMDLVSILDQKQLEKLDVSSSL